MPRIKCHYVDCVFVDDGFCLKGLKKIGSMKPNGTMRKKMTTIFGKTTTIFSASLPAQN